MPIVGNIDMKRACIVALFYGNLIKILLGIAGVVGVCGLRF